MSAEDEADISMEYEVAAVPTILFTRGTKIMDRLEGAKVADLTRKVICHEVVKKWFEQQNGFIMLDILTSNLKLDLKFNLDSR